MENVRLDVLVVSFRWEREKDFVAAIADEGFRVQHTSSTVEALPYLTGESEVRLVVLGREIQGGNPFDLLFEASQQLKAGRVRPKILLTQSIRADYELVALLERRGVKAYLDEADDLRGQVHTATGMLYASQRASERYPFKRAATVRWNAGEATGTTTDISVSGVGFVLDAKTARALPSRGSRISLLLSLSSPAFFGGGAFLEGQSGGMAGLGSIAGGDLMDADADPPIACIIRAVSVKSRFFGDLAIVGLEFDQPDERTMQLVKGEIERIAAK